VKKIPIIFITIVIVLMVFVLFQKKQLDYEILDLNTISGEYINNE